MGAEIQMMMAQVINDMLSGVSPISVFWHGYCACVLISSELCYIHFHMSNSRLRDNNFFK